MTAERWVSIYMGFLATAGLIWFVLGSGSLAILFSPGNRHEGDLAFFVGYAAVLLAFSIIHLLAVWLLWCKSRIGRYVAEAAFFIDIIPAFTVLLMSFYGFYSPYHGLSLLAFLPTGLLSMGSVIFGIYLFGFNRDIKQVFSASPAPKAPQRAKR